MSYAGLYDPTPVPEPKKKPKMSVELRCGETVMADNPWWSSDPIYGGWNAPYSTWCPKHKKSEIVARQSWPPKIER